MKAFLRILTVLLWVAGCSLFQKPTSSEAWEKTGERPKRLLLLVGEKLSPGSIETLQNTHLSGFKKQGLVFPKAWVGHLPVTTEISQAVLFSGYLPKNLSSDQTTLLSKIPGETPQKLIVKLGKANSSNPLDTFFKENPNWSAVAAIFSDQTISELDKEMSLILKTLEENNWLKETLIVFTAYQGLANPPPSRIFFPKEKWPEIRSVNTDSVLQINLKSPPLAMLLKSATKARNLPGVQEVYYKQEISKRYHYIRTFRSPEMTEQELDWSKNYHGILTQSLASKKSADLLCLLRGGGAQETSQRIPLIIWSPNLHFENEAILNQLQTSRVRLVDVHTMILKLMGLQTGANLDGSSLGIESIAY